MPELFTMVTVETALQRLRDALPPTLPPTEMLATSRALGRVLAQDVIAAHPLPAFPRSTVDGYAVRAADTVGASEGLPAYLRVVGELAMGRAPELTVDPGEAAVIHTGGTLPPGADAVVMVEHTQLAAAGEIAVMKPTAPGRYVIQVGEDVQAGAQVLAAGRRLRAQEIGGLLALGVTEIAVARRPRVAILSTGDELVPPEQTPGINQVRDINSAAIAVLVETHGGVPLAFPIVPDDADKLHAAAARAFAEADALIITAGSSVSARDMTVTVIAQLGEPGVLVHGVAMRPGKPTILAVCGGKPVFGLPGNPVSALNAARLFVLPTLWRLQGATSPRAGYVRARLMANLPAGAGRETYISVTLEERADGLWAQPIFGESNLIFTLVRAEGLVRIPLGVTGLAAGVAVDVEMLP